MKHEYYLEIYIYYTAMRFISQNAIQITGILRHIKLIEIYYTGTIYKFTKYKFTDSHNDSNVHDLLALATWNLTSMFLFIT